MNRHPHSAWLGSGLDACSLWRMQMPHLNQPNATFMVFGGKVDYTLIAANDIIVVQRCFSRPQLEFLQNCKRLGMKIVYDLDDNIFDIPSFNPHARFIMDAREGFKACMSQANVISVSTRHLKKQLEIHAKDALQRNGKTIPVVVAENRIDTRLFSAPVRPPGQPRVGWGGSHSHIGDLALIEDAVHRNAKENPNAVFEFRGLAPNPTLLKNKNVRFRYWVPVGEFCSRTPQWSYDLTLAPVTGHVFNDSKSPIKAMEAGWCGIPCLMSWQRPYEEFVQHDSALRSLLCPSTSSWYTKIRELLHEPERRAYYGERMRKVVLDHYTFDRPHEGWQAVFAAL